MSDQKLVIVFALFPGVTQLDFTGPHQVFSQLPGAEVVLATRAGEAVEADGITFAGLQRLADIARCDAICVPGGRGTTDNAIGDAEFLDELRRLAGRGALHHLRLYRVAGARRGRIAARQARRLSLGVARHARPVRCHS